ncbi:FKBP-type peptidyl-prolyl cis-trans isomerase [Alteromonadaceae bacterium BrNp21-10]|nr:FKBP-type peptidyl-prolyl cis-trans isomerase [Alteromonadaceae bacterium BrNp21-10]
MKYTSAAMLVVATLGMTACQPQKVEETKETAADTAAQAPVENATQQQSYAIGASVGQFVSKKLEEQDLAGVVLDRDVVIKGFKAALGGNVTMTIEEIQAQMTALEASVREMQQKQAETAGAENTEKGQAYLAENAKREGVTVTESGLQYEVLKQGDGPKPTRDDTVKVHYKGTLLDGTEFDSSYSRNEPAVFPLTRVISGWTEGVQLMNVGSTYRFHIPSNLAYGTRNTGKITPNSTLIFDVELLSIEETTAAK